MSFLIYTLAVIGAMIVISLSMITLHTIGTTIYRRYKRHHDHDSI